MFYNYRKLRLISTMKEQKKEKYFMTFYKDIALLHSIANKQTLFFMEMVLRMDSEQNVQMTQAVREKIMLSIGSKEKNLTNGASQYLKHLKELGLIRDKGKGEYMVNPKIHGFSNDAFAIQRKSEIFMNIKYTKDGGRTITVDMETGEIDGKGA